MDKKRNQNNGHGAPFDDEFPLDVVSATEATGMVPTPPLTQEEAEGYRSLFRMPQPIAENAKKADSPQEQKKRGRGC